MVELGNIYAVTRESMAPAAKYYPDAATAGNSAEIALSCYDYDTANEIIFAMKSPK